MCKCLRDFEVRVGRAVSEVEGLAGNVLVMSRGDQEVAGDEIVDVDLGPDNGGVALSINVWERKYVGEEVCGRGSTW